MRVLAIVGHHNSGKTSLIERLIPALRAHGIDSRPFFHPLDTLPPYCSDAPRPVALHLSQCGLNLPSSPSLTDEQVAYICEIIRSLDD